MDYVTTFSRHSAWEKAKSSLEKRSLPYKMISPDPGYSKVGIHAIIVDSLIRSQIDSHENQDFSHSGWVEYRAKNIVIPQNLPPVFEEDIFGEVGIMVLAPCVADTSKIRFTAHISGDLGNAFPFLNAEMKGASYNPKSATFTFMEQYRMIALYPHRITVAKADEIIDAWRVLELIRRLINSTWERRSSIEPLFEMRKKPPALEIFKRLPGTNCGLCGEKTCMAFALRLWHGEIGPMRCELVFKGDFNHFRPALEEICLALGVDKRK